MTRADTPVTGLRGLGSRLPRGDCLLVADPRLTLHPVVEEVRRACEGRSLEVVTTGAAGRDDGVEALLPALSSERSVIAVGGGRTIDTVKLALVARAVPGLMGRLRANPDRGATHLGDLLDGPRPFLAAVPTTLGTGSERSQSAILDTLAGRHIVGSPAMRPGLAVYDASATRGLARPMVAQGIFEVLCRVVNPLVASSGLGPTDRVAAATACRLVQIGEALCRRDEPGDALHDGAREEVASLSGLSHTAVMHSGRAPGSFPLWCVATELSWATSLDKVSCLALLLPAAWSAASDGEPGWAASPARIDRVWTDLRGVVERGLPVEPVDGLVELLTGWGLARAALPGIDRDAVAERVVLRWSGENGPLGRLRAHQVASLLSRVTGLG